MSDDPIEGMMRAVETAAPVQNGAAADKDLSGEVERAVERQPMDWVRCVRVFGSFYRCNWWSRKGSMRQGPDFDWAGLITDHVRKSCFLKVTIQGGQLVIDEVRPNGS